MTRPLLLELEFLAGEQMVTCIVFTGHQGMHALMTFCSPYGVVLVVVKFYFLAQLLCSSPGAGPAAELMQVRAQRRQVPMASAPVVLVSATLACSWARTRSPWA